MPKWLDWLRGEQGVGARSTPVVVPSSAPNGLPPEPPAGVDGTLWASWAARWQEF